MADLIVAADLITALIEASYTYDILPVKRSLPDADACELCEENADVEWILDEELFPSGDDGPPYHPHCKCDIEWGEKRKRVYD